MWQNRQPQNKCTNCSLTEEQRQYNGAKTFSLQTVLAQLRIHTQKYEPIHTLHHCQELIKKWITCIHVKRNKKNKKTNLLDDNIGENLENLDNLLVYCWLFRYNNKDMIHERKSW